MGFFSKEVEDYTDLEKISLNTWLWKYGANLSLGGYIYRLLEEKGRADDKFILQVKRIAKECGWRI